MILKDYCETIVDCEHKTAPTQSEGYPLIRTPNIGRGRFILDGVNRVSQITYEEWSRRATPKDNDLILAREAPIGNIAIIKNDQKFCLGQRTVLIRPNKNKVNPDYLLYLLLSDAIQGQILGKANGATVHHLNMKDIRELRLPEIPERKEQDKIAGILSAYDSLIEINKRRIYLLEQMAKLIYSEWFVKFKFPGHENLKRVDSGTDYGEVPERWEVKNLGDVCNITMGQSPKSEFYNDRGEGLPFHQGVTDFGTRFPSNTKYCSVGTRIANREDILISVRAPVGRINLSKEKIVIGRGLSALRHKRDLQTFLFYQLKRVFVKEDSMGGGTIFNSISKEELSNVKILVPADKIDAKYDSLIKPIDSEILVVTKENEYLSVTRETLLSKLMSGRIDVSKLDIRLPKVEV
jgi:type I restriction enzyme S subunit